MIGRFVAQPLPSIRPGASTASEKNASGEAPENGRRQNDKGGTITKRPHLYSTGAVIFCADAAKPFGFFAFPANHLLFIQIPTHAGIPLLS